MKIYTKTGDRGETGLFGGGRVAKNNLRIEAYGSVDELNAVLGNIRALEPSEEVTTSLHRIQNDLFIIGAELATPDGSTTSIPRIDEGYIGALEKIIDRLEEALPPLKEFILPSGSVRGTHLHFARTVCRRTERHVVSLSHSEQINGQIIIYLNRLSDLLFVMARYENLKDRMSEEKWKKPE